MSCGSTTKLVDVSRLPDRTVVVRFDMRDKPAEHYWLILRRPHPELCTRGLGHVEDSWPTPTPAAWSTST
jgi:hypothetical protein